MKELMSVFKTLSDETRLRIVLLLSKKEHCVCELTEILNESQPKISKHLSKLKDLNFVETKRNQQFIYYALKEDNILLNSLLEFIQNNLEKYPTLFADHQRIAQCTININP